MSNTNKTYTPAEIYGKAGLIYIRAPSKVEKKKNGQQKIKANPFPNHGLISQQRNYNENSGNYYALLMGRQIKPGRWVLLLDFDNKEEDGSVNGLELIKKLNMDQYRAPCQSTPSGGFHYLFYADASQQKQITSRTTIEHEGVKYNMDVKFTRSLCTCAPTKIEGYGPYRWKSASALLDIPKLPDELFQMISSPVRTAPTRTPRATTATTATPSEAPTATTATPSEAPTAATEEEIQDLRAP